MAWSMDSEHMSSQQVGYLRWNQKAALVVYRRSVWMGTTDMSRTEFRSFIENLAGKYNGNTYNLISKNCNHFTDDVCKNLTRKSIPGWVNRLARVGWYHHG
uniref:PPPDE domain-containing protein n=1 Tax=Arundo donax TaxID=35708 RepID=A0A0A9ER16_ARUDO